MSTIFADSRTEVQRYRHIDNGYHSHLLISAIFKDNERTTVSCGGAQGVLLLSFFFVKSDTHYKNPWSHAKLFFRQTNVTLWSNYQLNYLPWQAEILAQRSNLTPQRANRIPWFACGTEVASLRSRRLEVVGERKNGRARGRHERGEGGFLSPRVSPPRAPVVSCAHHFLKHLLRRLYIFTPTHTSAFGLYSVLVAGVTLTVRSFNLL